MATSKEPQPSIPKPKGPLVHTHAVIPPEYHNEVDFGRAGVTVGGLEVPTSCQDKRRLTSEEVGLLC